MTGRTLWRVAQWLLGAAVIALAARSLLKNWNDLQAQPVVWTIRPLWVLAAVALMLASYVLQIEVWRRVVGTMGYSLRWAQAARITTVSNLGKYLPGKVWTIAGAAMMAQQEGVAAGAAVAAAILLQGLAVSSGVAAAALLGRSLLDTLSPELWVGMKALGAVAIAGTFLLAIPAVVRLLQRLLPASAPKLPVLGAGTLAAAFIANALVWGATGLSFVWLSHGLLEAPGLTWSLATSVFTLAYIAGLVAVFAPGGIGVRESLVVLLLQGAVGPKIALALALASRVLLTCTELGAALPFLRGRARTPLTSTAPGDP
jgi:uncharacterized membrane protein YbhN (UPF0104 family)